MTDIFSPSFANSPEWQAAKAEGEAWARGKAIPAPADAPTLASRLRALLATPQPDSWPLPVSQADLRAVIAELEARQVSPP